MYARARYYKYPKAPTSNLRDQGDDGYHEQEQRELEKTQAIAQEQQAQQQTTISIVAETIQANPVTAIPISASTSGPLPQEEIGMGSGQSPPQQEVGNMNLQDALQYLEKARTALS